MALNDRCFRLALAGVLALNLCSCSSKRDYGKETFPVTGEVYVDGQPAARLSVNLYDVKGIDEKIPVIPTTVTKQDGTFSISTFEAGDGAPAGEYVATFAWGELRGLSIDTSLDKLKGEYSDPKTSEFKVTVTEGQPTDMGRIELTTK